jgi:hypothetical protein
MYVKLVADTKDTRYETPSALEKRLETVLELQAQRIWTVLRGSYPPTQAPSGYRRTGRLRDEWRYFRSRSGGQISFRIQNDARNPRTGKMYSSFVQGLKQTEAAANLGWQKAETYVDSEKVAGLVQDEISRYLSGR